MDWHTWVVHNCELTLMATLPVEGRWSLRTLSEDDVKGALVAALKDFSQTFVGAKAVVA